MSKLIDELANLKPNATFLALRNYTNSSGEVADYSIVFHMSYKNAVERSLEMIEEYEPTTDVEKKAKEQLINSYTSSLTKIEYNATCPEGEEILQDGYQSLCKGVKLHIESGNVHIYGLLNKKTVHTPGEYKTKNSSELTKTKSRLSKDHPVNKFRQFIVAADKVDCINVQKLNIVPEE